MRGGLSLVLVAALCSCVRPSDQHLAARPVAVVVSAVKPAAPAFTNKNESTFIGTVTGVDIGNVRHPYLRWLVTLKIDQVVSGPSPGEGFWFAIHSPSQEGLKVGQRYRISARKTKDGYELMSRARLD